MGKNGNMWPFQVPKQIANAENTDQSEVTWCMNFFETKKKENRQEKNGKERSNNKAQENISILIIPDLCGKFWNYIDGT